MTPESKSMKCREGMAVATLLLAGGCRHRKPGDCQVGSSRQGAWMIYSAAHIELQERGSSFLLHDRRCQQLRASYTVTFRTLSWCRLLHTEVIWSIRYGITVLNVRRRRCFANHLQRVPLLSRDWRSGYIPGFVKVCDEASNMHILVMAGVRNVRRQGHDVSTRIIRRVLTAFCDRFVNVMTKSRHVVHGHGASCETLLLGYLERGVV